MDARVDGVRVKGATPHAVIGVGVWLTAQEPGTGSHAVFEQTEVVAICPQLVLKINKYKSRPYLYNDTLH